MNYKIAHIKRIKPFLTFPCCLPKRYRKEHQSLERLKFISPFPQLHKKIKKKIEISLYPLLFIPRFSFFRSLFVRYPLQEWHWYIGSVSSRFHLLLLRTLYFALIPDNRSPLIIGESFRLDSRSLFVYHSGNNNKWQRGDHWV